MLPGIRIIPGIIGSRRLVERTAHARRRAQNGTDSHSAKNHVEKWRPRVHRGPLVYTGTPFFHNVTVQQAGCLTSGCKLIVLLFCT